MIHHLIKCVYFNKNKKYKKNDMTFGNTSSNTFIETNIIQDKV